MSESYEEEPVEGELTALGEEVEVVDAVPVVVERPASAALVPVTAAQAAAVAATGFVAGAVTVAAVRRHRTRKLAKRSSRLVGQVVGTRRFLVDVSLLRD